MCRTCAFLCGLGLGLGVVGVVYVMTDPQHKPGHHAVEKTMQRVGSAVDSAIENVTDMMD